VLEEVGPLDGNVEALGAVLGDLLERVEDTLGLSAPPFPLASFCVRFATYLDEVFVLRAQALCEDVERLWPSASVLSVENGHDNTARGVADQLVGLLETGQSRLLDVLHCLRIAVRDGLATALYKGVLEHQACDGAVGANLAVGKDEDVG
jgi:hypothetical protein